MSSIISRHHSCLFFSMLVTKRFVFFKMLRDSSSLRPTYRDSTHFWMTFKVCRFNLGCETWQKLATAIRRSLLWFIWLKNDGDLSIILLKRRRPNIGIGSQHWSLVRMYINLGISSLEMVVSISLETFCWVWSWFKSYFALSPWPCFI